MLDNRQNQLNSYLKQAQQHYEQGYSNNRHYLRLIITIRQ